MLKLVLLTTLFLLKTTFVFSEIINDYDFLINGYDEDGKKTSIQFSFKNDKPAKRLINELQMTTQLGMGQTRTAREIRDNESKRKQKIKLGRFKPF